MSLLGKGVVNVRRRQFLGMAAGLTGAAGLAATACDGNDESAGEEIVLKLVGTEYGTSSNSGSAGRYWNEVAEAFRKEHPRLRVDVTMFPHDLVDAEVTQLVADGEAPDLAQVSIFAAFAEADALYPANELLSLPVQTDFVPSLATAGELHRVQYGMPFMASTRRLFYNKELFSQAGLDPDDPPQSWQDLREVATALKEAGVPVPYATPFGPEEAQAEAMSWMLSGGGGLTDATGHYTILSDENIETFTWLREEMIVEKLTHGRPEDVNRQRAYDEFAAGKVAMLNGDPTLLGQANWAKVEFGTAPVPGKAGPVAASVGVSTWLMAFRQRGLQEEIAAFLDFLYREDNIGLFAERYDLLPVTTPGSEAMHEDGERKSLVPFMDQLPGAAFYPVSKPSWAEAVTAIRQEIGGAVELERDVEEVLRAVQSAAEALEAES